MLKTSSPINNNKKEGYKVTFKALQCINKTTYKLKLDIEKWRISDILLCKKCKPFFENLKEYNLSKLKPKHTEEINMSHLTISNLIYLKYILFDFSKKRKNTIQKDIASWMENVVTDKDQSRYKSSKSTVRGEE